MRIYVILLVVFTLGFMAARVLLRPDRQRDVGVGTWVSFALPVLAGFAVPQPALFMVLAAVLVIVTTRTRIDAAARAAILLPLLPSAVWEIRISEMWFGTITAMTALMLGALVAGMMRGGLRRRRWGAPELLALTLLLIFSFGDMREYNLTALPRALGISFFTYVLPLFVFSRTIADRHELERIVLALSAASIILAVIAIYEAVYGWSLYDGIMSNIGNVLQSRNTRVRAGLLRAPTAFFESTSFAVFQMIGCLATIAMRPAFRNSLFWLGAVVLCSVGLLAAQSRGADLGMIAGGAAMLLVRRHYGAAFGLACSGALAVAGLFVASASSPRVAAFLGRDVDLAGYRDYRELLLERGLEEGLKSPWLGTSDAALRISLADIVQGEKIIDYVNSYLKLFLVSGAVGLGAVLICLYLILMRTWARPSGRSDRQLDRMQMFLAGALVATMTALFFTAFWERNPIWLLLLAAGAARLHDAPQGTARRQSRPRPLPVERPLPLAAPPRAVPG